MRAIGRHLSFQDPLLLKVKDIFGGHLLKNSHAKVKRPLESKLPLHIVLASNLARGRASMRHPANFRRVNLIVTEAARKNGVRVYQFANAGNHLHILARLPSRRAWQGFIREISGRIARLLKRRTNAGAVQSMAQSMGTGSSSGLKSTNTAAKRNPSFWRQRPFTRIIRGWRRAYRVARDYVILNFLESEGFVRRQDKAVWQSFSSA